MNTDCTFLLPGWLNSDPGHWQSLWEQALGHRRIEQANWDWPLRGDWMMRLEETLLDAPGPAVLVAHSLGCQLVASWASHSQHTARVKAALLVAPPDTERADMPPQLHSWRPIARQRLPFASTVVYSSNDPFCNADRAQQMAQDWGAHAHSLGDCGHINTASGLGLWPEGQVLLADLCQRAAASPHL